MSGFGCDGQGRGEAEKIKEKQVVPDFNLQTEGPDGVRVPRLPGPEHEPPRVHDALGGDGDRGGDQRLDPV